ncbi:PREDICTED: T-cell surface glycoprotein CD8 alpha chain-like [Mesitornis unicolor]|uniref:T-cell surface glycoprotein CD8 alpha chain-like n=1 Tax=Mesitornis unicolor TaxID=54374 RepID=UPI0005280985|nr:PREDICTED: T-cell surface glycoprotein CD8 alpha chain-like [Mesitornis unicolor]
MARTPELLLLLALGLCCPGIRGQRYQMTAKFRDSSITHPEMGQRLELECLAAKVDSGIFWIRQDKGGTLHFIVFISSLSWAFFTGNEWTSTRFETSNKSKYYQLVVKSFMPQDEGTYFCLTSSNQVLYYSPGLPVFFPVNTNQYNITKEDPCLKTPETRKDKELNFFCAIFLWLPLIGAFLLVITTLAVTIVLCQRKFQP